MKSLFSNRRGQIGSLGPAMLALVFAAIVLIFGLVISQSLRDVDVIKNSATVTNETNAWLNISGYTVKGELGTKTESFGITAIWANIPSGAVGYNMSVTLANATIDSDTGLVYNATEITNSSIYNNVSLTYTYLKGDEAWDSANSTLTGLGTFGDFWEIIVLAIVITLVIGLLLATFGGRKQER